MTPYYILCYWYRLCHIHVSYTVRMCIFVDMDSNINSESANIYEPKDLPSTLSHIQVGVIMFGVVLVSFANHLKQTWTRISTYPPVCNLCLNGRHQLNLPLHNVARITWKRMSFPCTDQWQFLSAALLTYISTCTNTHRLCLFESSWRTINWGYFVLLLYDWSDPALFDTYVSCYWKACVRARHVRTVALVIGRPMCQSGMCVCQLCLRVLGTFNTQQPRCLHNI
jgi:hypothetical protein